jgi:hypothetical protein
MRTLQYAVVAGALLFESLSCFAWSSPGHMIIGDIAYRDLPGSSKSNVNEVLKNHPDYAKWAESYPADSAFDLPTFIYMRASTWLDEIRRKSNLSKSRKT